MKLSIKEIEEIAGGVSYLAETAEGIELHRFSSEQEELYKRTDEDFYLKTGATAGVCLSFFTDSRYLTLSVASTQASSRHFYAYDVLVNNVLIGSIDNFSDTVVPKIYSSCSFPAGESEKTFELGEGEKRVDIFFPWSVKGVLKELALDDGAFAQSARPEKKLLMYGDSITQGYDALHPSNRYPALMCRSLNLSEHNKAIGGEATFPELADTAADILPDYIAVAYGTNDWSHTTESEFVVNTRRFYENLLRTFPQSEVFCIAPIWRKDHAEYRRFGQFRRVHEMLSEICAEYGKIHLLDGYAFVPQDTKYFADGSLHPNDEGFIEYASCLENAMKSFTNHGEGRK